MIIDKHITTDYIIHKLGIERHIVSHDCSIRVYLMYVCVCVCVCTYCMYVCMYGCMYVCMYVCMCVCVCVCVQETWIQLHCVLYRHSEEFKPIMEHCQCYSCLNHTRAYIHHLLVTKELLAHTLLMK